MVRTRDRVRRKRFLFCQNIAGAPREVSHRLVVTILISRIKPLWKSILYTYYNNIVIRYMYTYTDR